MSEHPLSSLARRAWDAIARSDIDGLREIIDADVVWHATGVTPWRGHHQGFDAVLDYLARVGEFTDGFDARLDDILVSGERVLLLFHVALSRDGKELGIDYQCLARVEDERALEVWTAPLDPDAVGRFFAH